MLLQEALNAHGTPGYSHGTLGTNSNSSFMSLRTPTMNYDYNAPHQDSHILSVNNGIKGAQESIVYDENVGLDAHSASGQRNDQMTPQQVMEFLQTCKKERQRSILNND